MKALLEAGVHFGHRTQRWNPKMEPFIYGRHASGIYIIDLQKTLRLMRVACAFLQEVALQAGNILFVGTKKQARDIIEEQAQRCGQFYVSNRWLGGMLTNFQTIRRSIGRLKQLEEMEEKHVFDELPKKEVLSLNREKAKLLHNLQGIKTMGHLPSAVVVVDTRVERIAVAEANRLRLPVVAIVDTNCDPDTIQYPIPGNDDAIRSIRLIVTTLADAALDARGARSEGALEQAEPDKPTLPPAADARPAAERPEAPANNTAKPPASA
jgi:small subunit ribosomal protein S2